jgi:aprataxin
MSWNNSWKDALVHLINDSNFILIRTEDLACVIDKYAKAKFHYLIMPYRADLDTIYDLTKDDLPLLDEMDLLGRNVIEARNQKIENFIMGFHIMPSMSRLHLHVVSKDFCSDALKHKKHWNSFNTEYTISIEKVKGLIEQDGFLKQPSGDLVKELLNTPLKCNTCSYVPKHMPDLKKHLLTHLKDYA